jgi:hypothetical protein
MIIGTTFSHRHSQHLRLPESEFQQLLDFGFDTVRLACYWDEIEPVKGEYSFAKIRKLLDQCEDTKQRVVLSVGMKAPRWPEYYFPAWLPEKTPVGAAPFVYHFLERVIKTLREYTCISQWQIENEPLDPSGPGNLFIPEEILRKEIEIARAFDNRPVLVNLWGNEVKKRKFLPFTTSVADIIGLDLYYKVPVIAQFYRGPNESDTTLRNIIGTSEKPVWITELQAEPWEHNFIVPSSGKTPSMNEDLLRANFERAESLEPEAILLWGVEYWLNRKIAGDPSLWNTAKQLVHSA